MSFDIISVDDFHKLLLAQAKILEFAIYPLDEKLAIKAYSDSGLLGEIYLLLYDQSV